MWTNVGRTCRAFHLDSQLLTTYIEAIGNGCSPSFTLAASVLPTRYRAFRAAPGGRLPPSMRR
jgi:hypothetical protein